MTEPSPPAEGPVENGEAAEASPAATAVESSAKTALESSPQPASSPGTPTQDQRSAAEAPAIAAETSSAIASEAVPSRTPHSSPGRGEGTTSRRPSSLPRHDEERQLFDAPYYDDMEARSGSDFGGLSPTALSLSASGGGGSEYDWDRASPTDMISPALRGVHRIAVEAMRRSFESIGMCVGETARSKCGVQYNNCCVCSAADYSRAVTREAHAQCVQACIIYSLYTGAVSWKPGLRPRSPLPLIESCRGIHENGPCTIDHHTPTGNTYNGGDHSCGSSCWGATVCTQK